MKHSKNVITDKEILAIALRKAGSYTRLSSDTGISRATLWRIEGGAQTQRAYPFTIKRLCRYILEDA